MKRIKRFLGDWFGSIMFRLGYLREGVIWSDNGHLWWMLDQGFHQQVQELTSKWDDDTETEDLGRYYLAFLFQQLLVDEYDYHLCPSCEWATKEPNEHLKDPSSYCSKRLPCDEEK